MRILLIGASGKLGTAVHSALAERGHEIVTVSRTAGDLRYDFTDPAQVAEMYEAAGPLDAVAVAAGRVPYGRVVELTPDDYLAGFRGKVLSQIDVVRQGAPRVAERGSFTLISGVLGRDPVVTASAAAMANGALEAFVRAAAIELAPQRVNVVSPTVFTESVADYGHLFPGVAPVDLSRVAMAYVHSIEGAHTGRVYQLG
jgi:Short-chain dehydrogenases of various substrate specificities